MVWGTCDFGLFQGYHTCTETELESAVNPSRYPTVPVRNTSGSTTCPFTWAGPKYGGTRVPGTGELLQAALYHCVGPCYWPSWMTPLSRSVFLERSLWWGAAERGAPPRQPRPPIGFAASILRKTLRRNLFFFFTSKIFENLLQA